MSEPEDPDGGASNTAQFPPQMQRQPPIFRLPQEIRDKIFRLVLKEPDVALTAISHSKAQRLRLYIEQQQLSAEDVLEATQARGSRLRSVSDRRHRALALFHHDRQTSYNELLDPALLLTSKQFRLEASKILYQENTFAFNLGRSAARMSVLNERLTIIKNNLSRVQITTGYLCLTYMSRLEKLVDLITNLSPDLQTLDVSITLPTGGWIQSSYSQCVEMKWQTYESRYGALTPLKKLKVRGKCSFLLSFKDRNKNWEWADGAFTTVEQQHFVNFFSSIVKDVATVHLTRRHDHPSAVERRRYKMRRAQNFNDWYNAQPKPLPASKTRPEDDRFSDDWLSPIERSISHSK